MSTNSMIIQATEGQGFRAIYCHSDGYISHNGVKLERHYRDRDVVRQMIDNGDMSYLDDTLNESRFYARDRGATYASVAPQTWTTDEYSEMLDTYRSEYVYIQDIDGVWWVSLPGEKHTRNLKEMVEKEIA